MNKPETTSESGVYRDHLTRLPQLANAVIHTNIRAELEKLKSAPAWQQPAGRSSETLVKYADFRVVLVTLKQGSHVNQHHADGPVSVYCLQGKIRLRMPDGQGRELAAGDILALERGVQHDVEAVEESAFLLTIAWSKESSPVGR